MTFTLYTVFGFMVIFIATTAGAALVFFFKNDIPDKLNKLFLGMSSGIMLAASVWSLLLPAIDGAEGYGRFKFVPAVIGFILGGIFLVLLDNVALKIYKSEKNAEKNGFSLKKSLKMFFAITLHNIPEGLAVGFAFGGARLTGTAEAYLVAMGLAIGIAIQNFPEGAAVSLPLKNNFNRKKAFIYGMASGIVEPIAALIGYIMASSLSAIQPWFLSFAAGAMVYVVADELIPQAKTDDSIFGTWGVMIGFALMMALDVAL